MVKAKRKPGASMKVRVSTGIVETTKKKEEKQLSTVNTTVKCSHAFFHALFALIFYLDRNIESSLRCLFAIAY